MANLANEQREIELKQKALNDKIAMKARGTAAI